MSEVPEHLLPYLHYQIDGTIIGDTPEAQAYVEESGWNEENQKRYNIIYQTANSINKEITNYFNFLSFDGFYYKSLSIVILEKFIHTKCNSLFENIAILKTPEHKIELINILLETAKKESKNPIFLEIFKLYYTDKNINIKSFLLEKLANRYSIADIKQGQLKSINIKNYFCIEQLKLDNLASNEVYFLGRNGDGKTLILQAIVFALKYAKIKYLNDKRKAGRLLEYLDKNIDFSVEADTINNDILGSHVLADIYNVHAYGAHRHQHTTDKKDDDFDTAGFLTLFDNNKKLLSPDKWLLDTRMKELDALSKSETVAMTTNIATNLLENLLNDEDNENALTIEVDASKIEVRYKERNGEPIQFEQLSSGYQSVMVWVADLLARMSERQPHVTKLEDFEAIVLVDEVGLHLHPKWEYSIMKKLRTWFPKIQFIVTTHSPILLMGASEDAIIYKIDKQNGKTNLVGNIPQAEISQMMSNQIITSPLFGLDSMAPPNFETKNASNDDFIYSKIHEAIRTRLANQPTLDDDTILQWINDELNNLPPID